MSIVLKCINTQRYRRYDAAVIEDNAPSCTKRVVDTATATAVAATNGPTKENDRRLKKHVDKCRTKTGMHVCVCVYCYYCVFVCYLYFSYVRIEFEKYQFYQFNAVYNCRIS